MRHLRDVLGLLDLESPAQHGPFPIAQPLFDHLIATDMMAPSVHLPVIDEHGPWLPGIHPSGFHKRLTP